VDTTPTDTTDTGTPAPLTETPVIVAPVTVDIGAVAPARASRPSWMEPFPVVRIRGRLTATGARVTLLTVDAPRGAQIAVRCLGRGCPTARWAQATQVTRISRYEGDLPAGTRLTITVRRPGYVGKHTLIVIRRGRAPLRRDRCLFPGSSSPRQCPRT
jgi:hypothetical protein